MIIALDCEWNKKGTLLCLSYIIGDTVRFINGNEYKVIRNTLLLWKEHNYLILGHNIKSDLLILYETYDVLLTNVWDSMIAFQQLTNGKKSSASLGNVLKVVLNIEIDKSLQSSFLDKEDFIFTQEEKEYIVNDVKYLELLYNKINPILQSKGMIGINKCFTIDMQVLPVLVLIESKGMLIDKDKWALLIEEWKVTKEELKSSLLLELESKDYDISNLNLNSPVQIKNILHHFKVPVPIKDEKESTNKDLLAGINIEYPDNILYNWINTFIEYKKISKLISSFGNNIIDNLRNNATLHTEYTQCFTATGRLSSGKNKLKPYTINVQNIPARSKEGSKIMECIIARKGYNIVCCDMSGAELRIAASLSKDDILLDNFNAGGDFHSELATCSWQAINDNTEVISKKYNPKWLDTDFRTIHKQVNFGILYGCSAKRISEVLHINTTVAEKCKKAIEKKVPKLMNYLKSNQNFAKKNGYLLSPTMRIKYNLSMTEASNWMIQNLNSEAMKIALYKIQKYIDDNSIDAYIINTVHDSVIVEVKETENAEWIKDIMAESLGLFLDGVKGEADLSIAKYWKK